MQLQSILFILQGRVGATGVFARDGKIPRYCCASPGKVAERGGGGGGGGGAPTHFFPRLLICPPKLS